MLAEVAGKKGEEEKSERDVEDVRCRIAETDNVEGKEIADETRDEGEGNERNRGDEVGRERRLDCL